ncbi:MAG: hypothetical protein O2927_04725, partial [Planctomycetota bacterium]|nr:hypothetical protein [Planctomycetota bacterium]
MRRERLFGCRRRAAGCRTRRRTGRPNEPSDDDPFAGESQTMWLHLHVGHGKTGSGFLQAWL